MVVDTLFEYSLLVNLLLIGTCVGCTRWILVPWLIVYSINIVLLCVVAIYLFINPVPMFQYTREHAHYELMRLFGLVPIGAMVFLGKHSLLRNKSYMLDVIVYLVKCFKICHTFGIRKPK